MSSSLWDLGLWSPLIWDMAGLPTKQRRYGGIYPIKLLKISYWKVAHNTSAHILGQNSQLAKSDIKKGKKYHLSTGKSP